jgi:hypothetical protein
MWHTEADVWVPGARPAPTDSVRSDLRPNFLHSVGVEICQTMRSTSVLSSLPEYFLLGLGAHDGTTIETDISAA